MPFTEEPLSVELSHIKWSKAVASPFASGDAFRHFSTEIASPLYMLLQQWWAQSPPYIPSTWKDGWMVWLTKPNKPPDHPKNLRPLALQEPLGKCVTTLLARALRSFAFCKLTTMPQWAYISGRGTGDALARVSQHCARVQNMMAHHSRRTPHVIADGRPILPVCGGLQLFVDLSRAFDAIPREFPYHSLHKLEAPPMLTRLIQGWHTDTHYIVQHGQIEDRVPTAIGVRQGCPCAPTLWSIAMWSLLTTCFEEFGDWIQNALNLYADDFHVCDIFHNAAEFRECLRKIGRILDIITDAGLTINVEKHQIILAVKGARHAALLHQHTKRTAKGLFLRIPRREGSCSLIQLVKQTVYLGVVINYKDNLDATVRARIRSSWNAFRRLRKWLMSARCLLIKDRFLLWQGCVNS